MQLLKGGSLAWPVPTLLGMMTGILWILGLHWGAFLFCLAVIWCIFDRQYGLILLVFVGLFTGLGVTHLQQSRPNLLEPWYGANITVHGHWDGQFLSISDPPARMVLAPKPDVVAGQVSVSGRLIRPEGKRIPGGFDQAAWLSRQGGILAMFPTPNGVLVGAQIKEYTAEKGLRGWFRTGLSSGLNKRQSALMNAIELGNVNEIGREYFQEYSVREAFTRAGLAHLMALSGQNVALLIGAFVFLFSLIPLHWLPQRWYGIWRYGLPIILLCVYLVGLVGLSPSITRAVIMALAVLMALWIGRGKPDPLGTIAFAALACLFFFPLWLLDVGFQLSFLAVLGLTQTGRFADRLPQGWPLWIRLSLAVPIVAELSTLPVIASVFGQLPVVGLPANILAEFLMLLLVPLGFLAGLLGPAGFLVNWLVGPLASALLLLVEWFGGFSGITWGEIGLGGWAAYGLFILAAWLWLRGWIKGYAVGLVVMGGALLTWLPQLIKPPQELVFIDVGQGDSTLLRTPKLSMLIDGGGSVGSDFDVGGRVVVPALRSMGVRSLDVVVATHADTDHIEGLNTVLKQLPVGELWIGERKKNDPLVTTLLQTAKERGVSVREVRRGDQIEAGKVKVTVLWPINRFSTADNDNSIALRVDWGQWRAVLLGDLATPQETNIHVGKVDLLKVAHHGSRHSTSIDFLNEVQPKDAVISVGRNTYGHPSAEVIERLQARGIRIWRTDHSGTIRWPLPDK